MFLLSPAGCNAATTAQIGFLELARSCELLYALSLGRACFRLKRAPKRGGGPIQIGAPLLFPGLRLCPAQARVTLGFNSAGAAIKATPIVDANDSHAMLIANGSVTDLNSQVRQDSGWILTKGGGH